MANRTVDEKGFMQKANRPSPIGMKKDPAQKYRVSSIYIRKSVSVIMYCRRRHCASRLYETLATV